MALLEINLSSIAAGSGGGFALQGVTGGDQAGFSVAGAGDVNGDGYADLIIGAPFAINNSSGNDDAGMSYVVFGKPSGFPASVELSTIATGGGGFAIRGEDILDQSGWSVAGVGDLNADGFADIAVGARTGDGAGNAETSAGNVYVILGKASGFGAAVDLSAIAAGTGGFVIFGAAAGDAAGDSVAPAGDTNGDGLADLLIGARLAAGGNGIAYVILGQADLSSGPVHLADVVGGTGGFALTGSGSERAGSAVGGGDFNGDGLADLLVGAPTGAGATTLVLGRTTGSTLSLGAIAGGVDGFVVTGEKSGGSIGDQSGTSVTVIGDINGDGFVDLAIGAPFADGPAEARLEGGATYVVFGTGSGIPTAVDLKDVAAGKGGFVIHGQDSSDRAGGAVAGLGDVNGDGFDDLAIGARRADGISVANGETYILFGRSSGFGAEVDLADLGGLPVGIVVNGQDKNDESGTSVAAAGDVNGDGFADLLIGAPLSDGTKNLSPNAGGAYVIFGADFTGTVTHLGDNKANDLVGDSTAETMVGGQGGDFFIGNGGADVMYGGEGDDVFSVTDAFFRRIDGGAGVDTLAFDAKDDVLSLAGVAGTRLRSIESVSIYGTGANTLAVTARAVVNLSEGSNTLSVSGGNDDSVVLQDGGWSLGSGPAGFVTYINGNARLQVSEFIGTVVPCFAEGSRIATTRGEVAVEALREDDIALLAEGGQAAIRWIGHRATPLARHPRPWDVQPVRVAAHAFGPGLPASDLRLSPDHAVSAAGRLVPVRYLINGATIAQEATDAVTYFHIELAAADGTPTHGVILAQGLPVESFLDTGNRGAFANGGAPQQMHPDFALRAWQAKACAPLLTEGPALAELRAALLAHAHALGFAAETDAAPHLLADGRRIEVDWREGDTLGFVLPEGTREVRLASRTMAPAWMLPGSSDHRRLGVAVAALAIDGEPLAPGDSRLAVGWHAPEAQWRWTDGNAALPAAGACVVELRLAPIGRYWRARAGLSHAA